MGFHAQLAALPGHFVQLGLAGAGIQDEVGAFPGKGQCDLSPDVPAGPGYKGGLSFQSHGFSPYCV
jgi:hypothetical protein